MRFFIVLMKIPLYFVCHRHRDLFVAYTSRAHDSDKRADFTTFIIKMNIILAYLSIYINFSVNVTSENVKR